MRDRFTQEEANEILLSAIESQPVGREITREELASLAAEVGISPEALQTAEEKWRAERLRDNDDRQVFEAMQRRHQQAVTGFIVHLCFFLFFAFMFLMISMEEPEGPMVALAFMVPWLLVLGFHARRTFASSAVDQEKAFRKWQQARHLEDQRKNDSLGMVDRRYIR